MEGNSDMVGCAEGMSKKSPFTVQNSSLEELVPLKCPMDVFAWFTSIADKIQEIEIPPEDPPFETEIT
jgi:hypothetical protein